MYKVILSITFLLLSTVEGYNQNKLKIYFSGISDGFIKKSQLSDTAIKITTSINISKKNAGVTIYFSGKGFSNVMTTTVSLSASLKGISEKLLVGSEITIGDLVIIDPKTKKEIYFEGKSYKIIED